jgi:amidase
MQFGSVGGAEAKTAVSRRQFGKALSCAALTAFSNGVWGAELLASSQRTSDELVFRSVTELARMIRAKQISSQELVRAFLHRIDTVNRQLNAVCQLDREGALAAAKKADATISSGAPLKPLHGVPVTIKDSFDTAGMISTAGTQGRTNFVPKEDATVVRRLRDAGAIIMGKTNTPELTLAYETHNLVYGRTNNPYDLARTPGGSSGGAAAILAAGGSPADFGSDTAGSLRVPASFCGIAALKPTWGRISRAGHILPPGGVVGRRTHVGPLARYVEDLALLLPILCGGDSKDPDIVPAENQDATSVDLKRLKIAYFTNHDTIKVAPEIHNAVVASVKVLAEGAAEPHEAPPPGFANANAILKILNVGDGGDYYRKILRQCGTTQPSPPVAAMLEIARGGVVSGRKYADVLLDWTHLREAALDFMMDFDLLICPVCPNVAPVHSGTDDFDFSHSYYFNLLGWPSAVVRAGKTPGGLPIGVQIVARPWNDHHALAAARRIQDTLGGYQKDFPEKALSA